VIYRIIDEYKEWCLKRKEREIQEKLESATRPCKIKFLPGFVFRQYDPAIFGVEVLQGVLKSGVNMEKEDGKNIGKIKEMQKEGKTVYEAKRGDKVAVSIDGPVVGRHIKEGDILFSVISESDMKILKEVWDMLGEDEKELLRD
jgi:translation initiation factor 5B